MLLGGRPPPPLPPPTGLGGTLSHPGSDERCLSTKDTGASQVKTITCQTNSLSGHGGQFVPPPLGRGETPRARAPAAWVPAPQPASLGVPH